MNYDKLTKEQLLGIHKDTLEYLNEQEQEIERLKEEYMILQNASDEVEEELQQRINKAIEYIKQHNYPQLDEMDYYSKSELLDILKGADKE